MDLLPPQARRFPMILERKFSEIVEGLLRKTRQKKANWVESKDSPTSFLLKLPKSRIEIRRDSRPTVPDMIYLSIFDEGNRKVCSWDAQEGETRWEPLEELYNEIVQNDTDWDKVWEDIETFLKSA
jgi:hypothetical protein